jgi:hypothetical protein
MDPEHARRAVYGDYLSHPRRIGYWNCLRSHVLEALHWLEARDTFPVEDGAAPSLREVVRRIDLIAKEQDEDLKARTP